MREGGGLHLALPLDELLEFLLVVVTKVATDGLDKEWKLALVNPFFGHEGIHFATKTLPNEVLMVSFGSAKVSAGEGERCWTEGDGGRFMAF